MDQFIEVTNKDTGHRQWVNPALITRVVVKRYLDDNSGRISGLEITLSGDPEPVDVSDKAEIAGIGRRLHAKDFRIHPD